MLRFASLRAQLIKISIASFCLAAGLAHAAEVTYSLQLYSQWEGKDPRELFCRLRIEFRGEILAGDAKRLADAYKNLDMERRKAKCDERVVFLGLDSGGGSLDEAIALGRFVRRNSLGTIVDSRMSCKSACVFVFASGVNRLAKSDGVVGIHRPYFSSLPASLTYQQVQERRQALVANLKAFAREMDFSENLIDDMLAIAPEDLKVITSWDNPDYRIWGEDATWEEQRVAKYADVFGISSAEYRRRMAASAQVCGDPLTSPDKDSHSQCHVSLMANFSLEKAAEFIRRYENECPSRDASCAKGVLKLTR